MSNHNPPPCKHTQLTKKKKILLGTLIPFSLIIIALAVFLGMWFGCKKKEDTLPTNPQKWLVIDEHTIENDDYKVPTNTDIYYGKAETGDSLSLKLGHDDLNVKAFSDAHGGVTDFCVKGTIPFGFMVDPSMDFHLMGANNSLVDIKATSGDACGIIVGQTKEPPNDIPYNGNMNIENSVHFNISSSSNNAYGVYFYNEVSSIINVNGVWSVVGRGAMGAYLYSASKSALTIDGVWSVNVEGYYDATGFFLAGGGTIDTDTTLTIVGIWQIESVNKSGFGVLLLGDVNGKIAINGVWNISSNSESYGLMFNTNFGGILTIDGIWSICSLHVHGVVLASSSSYSTITINWMCTLFSYGSGTVNVNGILLNTSTNNGNIIVPNAYFFSNKKDGSNIFTKINGWQGSYKWNGNTIDKNTFSDTSKNIGDSSLAITPVFDTQNDQDYNFFIIVIGNAISASKETFNNRAENTLDDYIESNDCPPIAEQWLRAIAEQIPTV